MIAWVIKTELNSSKLIELNMCLDIREIEAFNMLLVRFHVFEAPYLSHHSMLWPGESNSGKLEDLFSWKKKESRNQVRSLKELAEWCSRPQNELDLFPRLIRINTMMMLWDLNWRWAYLLGPRKPNISWQRPMDYLRQFYPTPYIHGYFMFIGSDKWRFCHIRPIQTHVQP